MHLVHTCLFYFSAAPPLYPPCPAFVDHGWAPWPNLFTSPLSCLWWRHCCIALALPVLVWRHHPLALALPGLLLYPHHHHYHMPIYLPLPPTDVSCIGRIPTHHSCWRCCKHCNSKPSALTMPTQMSLSYVPCLKLRSTTMLASFSHVRCLADKSFHCPFSLWTPLFTLTPSSPSMLIIVCWLCLLKSQGVVDSTLWLRN